MSIRGMVPGAVIVGAIVMTACSRRWLAGSVAVESQRIASTERRSRCVGIAC